VGASGPEWVDELNESLHIMNHNIQAQVQRFTQDLHSQIENSLRPALAEVNKAIANIPKGNRSQKYFTILIIGVYLI